MKLILVESFDVESYDTGIRNTKPASVIHSTVEVHLSEQFL